MPELPSRYADLTGALRLETAEAVAGEWGTWRLTFEVGEHGIDDEGIVRLTWFTSTDWGAPQFTDPAGDNFARCTTTGRAELAASFDSRGHARPWFNAVSIRVRSGHLRPGDEVILTLGDRSGGSRGLQAPTAADPCSRFQAFVDAGGTRTFRPAGGPAVLTVRAGAPRFLRLVGPAGARPGSTVSLRVVSEDAWGNPAPLEGPPPSIDLYQTEGSRLAGGRSALTQPAAMPGVYTCRLPGLEEGVYVAICRAEGQDLGEGKAVLVVSAFGPELLWADLHGQSEETIGVGTAEAYFRFAREAAGLDAVSTQGNDFDITRADWEYLCRAADEANVEGEFVALRGYEWSGNIPGGGDRNVIFAGTDSDLHRSSNWYGDEGEFPTAYPIDRLHAAWRARQDVVIIPHVGGRYANLAFHDPDLEPAIEACSGWGHHDWFWQDALERGLVVGFIGASDEHRGRPGASPPGHRFGVAGCLTAFCDAERTRQGVVEAIRSRNYYATSGERLYLEATSAGRSFGACFATVDPFFLAGRAASAAGIDRVEVCRVLPGAGEAPRWTTLWSRSASGPVAGEAGEHCIRLRWRGNHPRMRARPVVWDGRLAVEEGRLVRAEWFAVDRHGSQAPVWNAGEVTWRSGTVGNEQGVLLFVEGSAATRLRATTAQGEACFSLAQLTPEHVWRFGADAVLCAERLRADPPPYVAHFTWSDEDPPAAGRAVYVLRVYDAAGHFAMGSPFYVDYEPEAVSGGPDRA